MKFKAYHKIRQFKDIIRDVQFKANFKGMDSEGQPIYEETKKPTLKFKGTIKLHGSNGGICYTPDTGVVAQKRSSLIDPDNLTAHFGFNQFVQVSQKIAIETLMDKLWFKYCTTNEQITLYGEYAGKGIQKGVGISEGEKAFYVFDCKVYNPTTDTEFWVDISNTKFEIENVYNIHDFTTFTMDIDFNNPGMSQNDLISYTNDVEKQCPVAGQLGHVGIGEGVVWTTYWNGDKYIMKVKGEKHSTSKVKKLASIDPEVLKNIGEFIDYACTANRIEQGIQETGATEKKDTPDLLRWVANDIISEEDNELRANNLEWKQVAREVSNRTRQYFFTKIDKI